MMNSFILNHVVLNVKKSLREPACLVFERALLWLICSPVVDENVPMDLKDKVFADSARVRGGSEVDSTPAPLIDNDEQESNPIQQKAVTVTGNHGAFFD